MARSRFSVKEGLAVSDDVTSTPYDLVPVGTVLPYVGSSAPEGWLLCDGSAISRATYPNLNALMAVSSYPFGSGNGTTTFNLPDLAGRMVIGAGDSSSASVPSVRTTGQSGGGETVVISSSNLPTHTHSIAHDHGAVDSGNQSADHSHSITHNHAAANTGNVSANHYHGVDLPNFAGGSGNVSSDHYHDSGSNSGHWHALYFVTDAAAGTAKARASGSGNTLGAPGATSYENHHHGNTGWQSHNHSHSIDHDHGAVDSGNISANHYHGLDLDEFTGNSGNVSANHYHSVDVAAFTGVSGDGGFANTALALMNPFLVLTYIIKY